MTFEEWRATLTEERFEQWRDQAFRQHEETIKARYREVLAWTFLGGAAAGAVIVGLIVDPSRVLMAIAAPAVVGAGMWLVLTLALALVTAPFVIVSSIRRSRHRRRSPVDGSAVAGRKRRHKPATTARSTGLLHPSAAGTSTPTPAPLRVPPPHPLMLEVAKLDGDPHPQFQEDYGELLNLDPDSLVPRWFPDKIEGEQLSPADRASAFSEMLTAAYKAQSAPRSPDASATSDSTSPVPAPSKPQQVLACLRLLHSAVSPEDNRARD